MVPGALIGNRSFWARFAFFACFWLMVAGGSAKDLPVGAAAGAAALWLSLKLLPPGAARIRPLRILRLAARLLWGSLAAGLDVARRALSPRPDLRPGFVACPLALPEGAERNLFCLLQSLMPGTLPTGAEGEVAQVHALDLSQPIAQDFSAQQRLFTRAVGDE
jgi:multicomponent Na+:H+ antiporter subunit E